MADKKSTNLEKLTDYLSQTILGKGEMETPSGPLRNKWWPKQKVLVNTFIERTFEEKLVVEELLRTISSKGPSGAGTSMNHKVTICGVGGVGKTTMAIWFANFYQDNYDFIIWIDCGEGGLSTLFQALAKELKLEKRDDWTEIPEKVYQQLNQYKCLFVFDGYNFVREGIKDLILPQKYANFHTIITRRYTEQVNEEHFGNTLSFNLLAFGDEDVAQFLRKNVLHESLKDDADFNLHKLSSLLGNLPLTLQIVITTLNEYPQLSGEMYAKGLKKYTQESNENDSEGVLNAAVKILVDLIRNRSKCGRLAFEILLTFSYVRSEAIELEFFADIESVSLEEVENAVSLLEKHSLIVRIGNANRNYPYKEKNKENSFTRLLNKHNLWTRSRVSREVQLVSISAMLQQAIRYNYGKEFEKTTISKILSNEGSIFMENKLIPYSKYAEMHKDLVKKFKAVRVELVSEIELSSLLKERRFSEAVELSKLLHENYRSPNAEYFASLYNHSVCLQKNGRLAESKEIFQELYHQMQWREDDEFMKLLKPISKGILPLDNMPKKIAVATWCYKILVQLKKADEAMAFHKEAGVLGSVNCLAVRRGIFYYPKSSVEDQNSILCEFPIGQLSIADADFFDTTGRIPSAKFHDLMTPNMRRLKIDNLDPSYPNNTVIHVDFSKLPRTLEEIEILGRVPISCSGSEDLCEISIKKLKLGITDVSVLDKILRNCSNLISLFVDGKYSAGAAITWSSIPMTTKIMELRNLAVIKDTNHLNDIVLSLEGVTFVNNKTQILLGDPSIQDLLMNELKHTISQRSIAGDSPIMPRKEAKRLEQGAKRSKKTFELPAKYLILKDTKNCLVLKQILSMSRCLVELKIENLEFEFDLAVIPTTVKRLKLSDIKVFIKGPLKAEKTHLVAHQLVLERVALQNVEIVNKQEDRIHEKDNLRNIFWMIEAKELYCSNIFSAKNISIPATLSRSESNLLSVIPVNRSFSFTKSETNLLASDEYFETEKHPSNLSNTVEIIQTVIPHLTFLVQLELKNLRADCEFDITAIPPNVKRVIFHDINVSGKTSSLKLEKFILENYEFMSKKSVAKLERAVSGIGSHLLIVNFDWGNHSNFTKYKDRFLHLMMQSSNHDHVVFGGPGYQEYKLQLQSTLQLANCGMKNNSMYYKISKENESDENSLDINSLYAI